VPLSPGDGAAPSPRALHYASILGLALINVVTVVGIIFLLPDGLLTQAGRGKIGEDSDGTVQRRCTKDR
jgi:hypothetical protein